MLKVLTHDGKPHQHRNVHSCDVYECCDCGAVRKRKLSGQADDPWHVCALCILAGYQLIGGVQ
jgi:hypothetical protein